MKENKSFFASNNRLNKGYAKIIDPHQPDHRFYRKKFEHILPPLELLDEYETLHPGMITRLIAMSEKEQLHRHQLEMKNIETYKNLVKKGRVSSIGFIIILAIITALFAKYNNCMVAIVFASATLLALVTSILIYLNSFKGKKNYSNK